MCEVFILSELFVAKTDKLNGNLVVREAFTMRSVRVLSQNRRKGRGGGNRCGKGLKGARGTSFFLGGLRELGVLGGLGELGGSRRTRGTRFF